MSIHWYYIASLTTPLPLTVIYKFCITWLNLYERCIILLLVFNQNVQITKLFYCLPFFVSSCLLVCWKLNKTWNSWEAFFSFYCCERWIKFEFSLFESFLLLLLKKIWVHFNKFFNKVQSFITKTIKSDWSWSKIKAKCELDCFSNYQLLLSAQESQCMREKLTKLCPILSK